MFKRKLTLASLVLVLGIAAGIGGSSDAISAIEGDVVAARFCPINIQCKMGRKARCSYSKRQQRCVCRCVPRAPQ